MGASRWVVVGVGLVAALGALVVALTQAGSGDVDPAAYSAERPRPLHGERPNVVLVIGCTLRRDQLPPWGGPPFAAPFLGRLAQQSTVFEHAVDSAPWTRPASTAILTGHHATAVGMVEPGPKLNRRRLSDRVTTLAERLTEAGYETIGITANPNLNRIFGFDQGFDAYHEAQGVWSGKRVVKVPALQLAVEALSLVDARAEHDAPLYLQMLTIDTHEPVDAGPRRARHMARDGVPLRVGGYRVELRRWDAGLDELWDGLNQRGYTRDNTVLVVVNDHGEGLSWPPEHGMGHGNFLLPSAVDMPWLLHGHGVARGHRVEGVASQVDVHPTILGLLGIEGYEGPGHDFSAQVRGESARTDRRYAFAETYYQRANRAAVYTEDRFCIHDFLELAEQLGLDRVFPRTACFDRTLDPHSRSALEEVDEQLLEVLMTWREEQRDAYDAWPDHDSVTRDDPVMKQLEELGYVE